MLIALTKNSTKEYILRRERNSKNPTIFILGALTSEVVARIQDSYTSYTTSETSDNDTHVRLYLKKKDIEYFRYGVKGWKNLKNENGEDVSCSFVTEYGENLVSKDSVNIFSLDIIVEIADEILRLNTVTEKDETDFLLPSQ